MPCARAQVWRTSRTRTHTHLDIGDRELVARHVAFPAVIPLEHILEELEVCAPVPIVHGLGADVQVVVCALGIVREPALRTQ